MESLDAKFKKELDGRDILFVSKYEKVVGRLGRKVKRYHASSMEEIDKDFAPIQADLKRQIYRCLKTHGAACYSMGRAHGHIEVLNFRPKSLAALPNEGINIFILPQEALKAIDRRELVLSGNVSEDIIARIKELMRQKLNATLSAPEVEKGIAGALKSARERGSLISITESTYYYNRGRIASFKEDDVQYVQFSAVMDMRTSEQCRSRHRLVMRLDDPDLAANTPPLHGRCRSILRPYYGKVEPGMLDWSHTVPLPAGWNQGAA